MAMSNHSKCQFLQGPFLCDIIMLRNETYWLSLPRPCFADTACLLRCLYQKLQEIERKSRRIIWSYHIRKSHIRNGVIETSPPKDCDGQAVLVSINKMTNIPWFRENKDPQNYSLTLRNELIGLLWGGDNRMSNNVLKPSPGKLMKGQDETYVVYINYKFSQVAWNPPQ